MNAKHIYWGIGIAAGLTTVGIVIYQYHNKIKDEAGSAAGEIADAAGATKEKLQNWLKPVVTKISSPFGYRTNPVTKAHQFHNGIDLPVPLKTKVKSPMNGTVENVYNNAAGGNQVIIKHENGYTTGYAHLTQALVKKGDKVKQGDIIALSGNTGKSTGPHVHFTLKDQKGNYLDPAKVVFGNVA